MAACCRRNLRSFDIFGRLGGEEFGVILPETEGTTAKGVANRLLRVLSELEIPWEDHPISFTASIGIASFQEQDRQLEKLLHRADRALYQAKNQGRNRVLAGDPE